MLKLPAQNIGKLQPVRRLLRRRGGGHGGVQAEVGYCKLTMCLCTLQVQAQEGRGQGEGGAEGAQEDPSRHDCIQDPGLHLP